MRRLIDSFLETEDPGHRDRPREGRIHDSETTADGRATNSSQSLFRLKKQQGAEKPALVAEMK